MNVYDPWYDDKLKLSSGGLSAQLGGYAPLPTVIEDGSFALQPEKTTNVAATEELLMEFDCVYGNVELNHLTPPQTPPQSSAFGGIGGSVIPMQQQQQQQQQQQLFTVPLQQQQQQLLQPLYAAAPLSNALPQQQQLSFQGTGSEFYIVEEYATMTQLGGVVQQQQQQLQQQQELPGDIGSHSFSFSSEGYTPQQMNEVESIVRSLQMVEESLRDSQQQQQQVAFNGGDDDDDDSCGFSETGSVESGDSSSLVSSSRSPVYSDSADSSYYGSRSKDRNDDEDWSPAKTKKLNLSGGGGGAVTKKRSTGTRPYGRGTEDKKSRKKEQNKNAATRYRQKKKAEIEEILTEENELRDRNEQLQAKSTDLGREIRCLKNLMRELLRGKGLM
uniref:BZIP domain-containing protein n=1 Tax=Anopheles atroparvus TaxID=41427 RepID=A0AAG5DJA1_ANOAO